MAYEKFAHWYDYLNGDADYDRLCGEIVKILHTYGVSAGIVADLGCGTGEMCLRLAKQGYEMIGVDMSADMLSIAREKLHNQGLHDTLLLCQALQELDLYGTINAAVCTFDTLNHLAKPQLEMAIGRVSTFMEKGGVFVADLNTPYKHESVLANNSFVFETGDEHLTCEWDNRYNVQDKQIDIELTLWRDEELLFEENITEYTYSLAYLEELFANNGMKILEVCDGESFSELKNDSHRMMITAQKL